MAGGAGTFSREVAITVRAVVPGIVTGPATLDAPARPRAERPIAALAEHGQSLWLDSLRRQLVRSGELARLRDDGVSGVTTNPTIFEKAISGSHDYDESVALLVRARRSAERILWDLMVEDVQAAADVLRPVHERTAGRDGYVSIEVSPLVAHDTRRTVAMARELFGRCDRPNVMVKVPATPAGVAAVRRLVAEGRSINVTLIFSVERYETVAEAYLAGLEELRAAGGDLASVASVASFFVSRVDTKVDALLAQRMEAAHDPAERARLEALRGTAAIDNSTLAYRRFGELFSGPRWEALAAAGARPQRCLWASTSTKDPRYPALMYVEALIGPDTVDTVPAVTLAALLDRGSVARTIDRDVEGARTRLRDLAALGVDLGEVTSDLEVEGVEAFERSYAALLAVVRDSAAAVRHGTAPRELDSLGAHQPAVERAVARLDEANVPKRLWAKDATLWTHDPARAGEVRQRLGWLDVAEEMRERGGLFTDLARDARGYRDVVLLGMGGSSLCADVLRHTFGPVRGQPALHVLDTTDPATIVALRARLSLADTLFIVASKSGDTTETRSHFAYFWDAVSAVSRRPGRQFAAITDGGTSLEALAREHAFRWAFVNRPDIGGRYSALSLFGLVPGALLGVDVPALLERALEMAHRSDACTPAAASPGLRLGAALGELASVGQDKVTFALSPKVATFGYWVEQLIAESTGKDGKGIVPVEGEPLGAPDRYGDDRLFVAMRTLKEREHPAVHALERAGRPVVTLLLRDTLDLGAEFLRWEIATAVAGSLLGIDAFDQPNVQESKDNTRRVLADLAATGALPATPAAAAEGAGAEIAALLRHGDAGAYVAFMAYTARSAASERALASMRELVRDRTRFATTAGYGPRFLHSTGQLHKGGPPRGLFVQIVQQDRVDAEIPGERYGFATLKAAQALGDLRSLESRGLPVVRVDLGRAPAEGWRRLAASLERSLA